MKNKITLLLLFVITSISGWAQSISFTSVPTSTPVGTSITINYKYTIASAGKVVLGINLYNDWSYISTVNYAELNPAVAGTDVAGSFTVLIPSGTTPAASLTGLQNYKINVELRDASNNYLAVDYVQNYNFTAAVTPAVSFTSVSTSTQVGTSITINYKYTIASAGKVILGINLYNDWSYISTVNYAELNPAVAGTDVAGSFTVLIPSGTTPTASLTGLQNYKINVELRDASNNYLAVDYVQNYNFTPAPTPSVSVTSIPTSTKVGTNLVLNYKYTAAATGKVTIGVSKNGGVNAWDYISTVVFDQLDPAVAGTDVTGTFSVLIPNGTTPTASLTGNENYRVTLELRDASNNWLAADYNTANYNFTSAATTWTGLTNTSWTNASNWSAGVPDQNSDVIIAVAANQPVIVSTATINSLTIATSASLNLNSGSNLTITDAIVNDGTLTIANNAYLLQVNNVANSGVGTTVINRNSSALLRLDYTMWSSPVSGTQTLAQFSPMTSQAPNRFYTYDAATNLYANVDPLVTSFAAGNGYLIRMPNDASAGTPTAFTGVFTGKPNNGNITLGIPTPLVAGKFYSLGNPYPSPISASSFIAGTTGLGTTLYFWRKTNGTANTLTGSSTGTAYATWTSLGGTASGTVAPNNLAPNGQIAVGQGFIVNTGTATTINFTNAMRTTTAATFLKTKAVATTDRVWLNLTNTTGAFSQTLIGYTANATLGVDNGIDGEYINDSPLALTSKINNKEYTIQGRATFDPTDVVNLNFKTDVAGDYTIAIDHTDGVFATGQDVYLVDSKTGTETNLKSGSYTFTAATGADNSRFSLKYQKTLSVNAQSFDDNSITVYANNGTLYVNSKSSAINNVTVYDVQGRLIAQKRNVKSTAGVINNLRACNQVLIVKIEGEDNSVVTKKVMN